jgi:hypothetical protein
MAGAGINGAKKWDEEEEDATAEVTKKAPTPEEVCWTKEC